MPSQLSSSKAVQTRSIIDREYVIGGGSDKKDFLSNVAGATRLVERDIIIRFNLYNIPSRKVLYRGHEEEDQIVKEIVADWKAYKFNFLRLTGHSWGGQAAMDITQELAHHSVPVKELITLDPVSMLPFSSVPAEKWVNVYIKQSFWDNTVGAIPVVNQLVSSVATLPTLFTQSGREGGYIANVGGQLGAENGAYNHEMDVSHASAGDMYQKALSLLPLAPMNPKVVGVR